MLLGPVFQTEMVTTARRTRYFVLRVLFAAALLLCLWTSYGSASSWNNAAGQLSIQAAAQMAGAFFQAFAWLTLITTLVVTPAIAAGAIATERERRTIEYLFATDLSNAEIVLSKLFGKLLLVGKLILVALPVLAIFRLMGGIPGNLLVVYFAGLASTATLLTVGAMCISVWTARARDAIIRVYLVVGMLFLLPIMLFAPMMATGGSTSWWATSIQTVMAACLAINPLYVLGTAITGSGALGVGLDASVIWQMVQIHLVLTVMLAGIAVAAVRRVHLGAISSPGTAITKRRFWQLPRFRPALGEHPMLWKELFARAAATKLGFLGHASLAILLIGTIGLSIWSYLVALSSGYASWWGSPGRIFLQTNLPITCLLGVGGGLLMGLRAAGLIAYEKERDCWLSLLSTPLTGAEIIGAKALGNLYAFRWMLLPLAIVWCLQISLSPQYIIAIPMHLATIGATGLFATAVGLGYSLKFESSLKAIGATMGTLFFVGGGYLLCCCVPVMIGGGEDDFMKIAMVACIPFLQIIPGLIVLEENFNDGEAWMIVDYVLGTAGYAIAGGLLLWTLVARFEALVGRTGSTGIASTPPVYTPPE